MLLYLEYLGFIIAVFVFVSLLLRILTLRRNGVIDEFEDNFPGKCGVCAFHSYGLREGLAKPGTLPNDHRCPEKWARWKGALH